MLTGNGVPNDVISNFNSLSIIVLGPCLNVSSPICACTVDNIVTDTKYCSTACTLHSVRQGFTTALLLESRLASSSALWPVSGTVLFATKHTRPTPAGGTEVLTQFALTEVLSRPPRSGGLRFHLLWVDSLNFSSTCQVRTADDPFRKKGHREANIVSSLWYRLLACACEHERPGVSHQPPEHWLCLHYQSSSLFSHNRSSPCLGLRRPCDRWRLCDCVIRKSPRVICCDVSPLIVA
jgi:hypothetical protein